MVTSGFFSAGAATGTSVFLFFCALTAQSETLATSLPLKRLDNFYSYWLFIFSKSKISLTVIN
jgi:hypothetical protein